VKLRKLYDLALIWGTSGVDGDVYVTHMFDERRWETFQTYLSAGLSKGE
jgi:hypothetical protein